VDGNEILLRLGLALAIGLLVGVERGWRERGEAEGERTAGLRTFALIGLSGGVWGLLSQVLGALPLAVAFLALAGALTLFRWRETQREKSYGATTLVASFLTFALGAYAVLGDMMVAAAAAVATTALLAAKDWLHEWLKVMTWLELRSALILLAMSFVVLPVLPDRGFGPYEAFNLWQLWLMTIVIACVSFIGYVAVKYAGKRYGPLIAGIAGGLVSSTALTIDFARRAKAAPGGSRIFLVGALAASTVMFLRVGFIVALFGPALLTRLAGPLAAATVLTAATTLLLRGALAESGSDVTAAVYRNPFELKVVLGFGVLLAAVVFLTKALTETLGGGGAVALAAIAGISDVDAITLSMTQVAGRSIDPAFAATAILVAVAVNSISKSVLAFVVGGRRFGLSYLAVSLSALVGGGIVAAGQAWVMP
jgi:uncharacterized membrane protein (DUF4010 family)